MNPETRTLHLWIENDYTLHNKVRTEAEANLAAYASQAAAAASLADDLATLFYERAGRFGDSGPLHDLLFGSLQVVDWQALAEVAIDNVLTS